MQSQSLIQLQSNSHTQAAREEDENKSSNIKNIYPN